VVDTKEWVYPEEGDDGESDPKGKQRRLKKGLGDSQSLRDLILSAIDGLKRYHTLNNSRDKRVKHGKPNLIWAIHFEAKTIVRACKRLPVKREIRKILEADGWTLKGKGAWITEFEKAGLDALDEWYPADAFRSIERPESTNHFPR